jgi:hypothetical protein
MDRMQVLGPLVRAWLAVGGVLLLCLSGAGCDALGGPEVVPLRYDHAFAFRVSGSQLQADQETEVVSQTQFNLAARLKVDGFKAENIVSVRVAAVEIERIQPLTVDLQFLRAAVLLLRSGDQEVEVASRSSFPADTTAELSPASIELGRTTQNPVSRGVLRLTPAQVSVRDQYRLEVRVRFNLEVEDG